MDAPRICAITFTYTVVVDVFTELAIGVLSELL